MPKESCRVVNSAVCESGLLQLGKLLWQHHQSWVRIDILLGRNARGFQSTQTAKAEKVLGGLTLRWVLLALRQTDASLHIRLQC
jgi:hypothetical protein